MGARVEHPPVGGLVPRIEVEAGGAPQCDAVKTGGVRALRHTPGGRGEEMRADARARRAERQVRGVEEVEDAGPEGEGVEGVAVPAQGGLRLGPPDQVVPRARGEAPPGGASDLVQGREPLLEVGRHRGLLV